MPRMPTRTSFSASAARLIVASLVLLGGCNEEYDAPPAAADAAAPVETDSPDTGGLNSRSTLGKARDSAKRSVKKAEDYNARLEKEMDDPDGKGTADEPGGGGGTEGDQP